MNGSHLISVAFACIIIGGTSHQPGPTGRGPGGYLIDVSDLFTCKHGVYQVVCTAWYHNNACCNFMVLNYSHVTESVCC